MANTCPVVEGGSGPKALKGGDYKFDKFCVEPTSFTVKEEKADGSTEFVKTKLMTRLTYTLDAMSGDMKVGSDGLAWSASSCESSSRCAESCIGVTVGAMVSQPCLQ